MIIVVPRETLTPQQKGAITKKGLIIIECDDPDKVRILNPETTMDNSDWFMSALKSLTTSTPISRAEHFVNNLHARLKASEAINPEITKT